MTRALVVVVVVALAAVPAAAHGAGFAVAQQNAVSSGTGGAGAARAEDPGAAWHVPAALADGGGWRAGASLTLAHPALEARAMDGSWTTESDGGWATPPHLDVSLAQGRWAVGLALGVPFGSGISWPADWPGRHEIVRTDLQVFRAAPFVAWRFGAVRVSAGLHLDAGRLRIGRQLDFIDSEGDVAIDADARGVGVDASIYWQARPDLGLGLTYRGRTALGFDGGADFSAPDAFSAKAADQAVHVDMTLPGAVVVGARWQLGRYASLVDVELTRWSVNQRLVVDFASDATPDAVQQNDWHDAVAVRAGGEWTSGRLTLRHGGYIDLSPAPAERLGPSSPDSTRLGVSAGASWRVGKAWSVDAFTERMWILRRESGNADALAASYGGTATILGVGVRWTP